MHEWNITITRQYSSSS